MRSVRKISVSSEPIAGAQTANYDETVHEAERFALENDWLLVQDTALPGFEKVAQFIMHGYLTMALETVEQLKGKCPTHIFLQAGVGSMAGAMCGFFASLYGPDVPVISIVEPKTADCVYRTAEKDDGKLHNAPGSLETIMAGLSCGEPCSVGWKEIRAAASHYFRIEESVAQMESASFLLLWRTILECFQERAERLVSVQRLSSCFTKHNTRKKLAL